MAADVEVPVSVVAKRIVTPVSIGVQYGRRFSPLRYSAKADGSTLDDQALADMIEAALEWLDKTGPVFPFDQSGNPVVLDGEGGVYAHSMQINLLNMPGVIFENFKLVAKPGGNLSRTVGQLRTDVTTPGAIVRHNRLYGNKFARGIELGGRFSKALHNFVMKFKGAGIDVYDENTGGRYLEGNRIWEYNPGDPEFAVQSNLDSSGIFFDDNDNNIGPDNIVRWCGICVEGTENAGTTMITNSHFYNDNNGAVGVPKRVNPKIIEWRSGGLTLIQNYLDNGTTTFYNHRVMARHNILLVDLDRVELEYAFGIVRNGNDNAPFRANIGDHLSTATPFIDGTIPMLKMLDGVDGAGQPASWNGNWSKYHAFKNRKHLLTDWILAKAQANEAPNITLFSPGSAANGARLSLCDADTTITNDTFNLPGIYSSGDRLLADKLHDVKMGFDIEANGDNFNVQPSMSGTVLHVYNANLTGTITYPNAVKEGFKHKVIVHGGGRVTVLSASGATMLSIGLGAGPFFTEAGGSRLEVEFYTVNQYLVSGDIAGSTSLEDVLQTE